MELFKVNLQLLAEGAGGAAGDGAAASTGVSAPDAGEQGLDLQLPRTSRQQERLRRRASQKREEPIQTAAQTAPDAAQTAPDAAQETAGQAETQRAAPGAAQEDAGQTARRSFDDLVKGEYKQDFDKRVQDILHKRFREDDARRERDGKIDQLLCTLGELTGVTADEAGSYDPEALRKALLDNSGIVDAVAMEAGVGTEQYLAQLQMRTENASMRRQLDAMRETRQQQEQEARSRQAFDALQQEAAQLQSIYPQLDFAGLMQDAQAVRTLQALQAAGASSPVRTVWEAMHRDEILSGVAQAAQQRGMQQVAASVAANGKRPQENGGTPQGGILTGMDVKNLSRQQRQDIRRRVARGEKIIL